MPFSCQEICIFDSGVRDTLMQFAKTYYASKVRNLVPGTINKLLTRRRLTNVYLTIMIRNIEGLDLSSTVAAKV